MEFITIDVETSNPDMSSICQIGMCHYKDGDICKEYNIYINPESYFDSFNVMIHGIDDNKVADCPNFSEIWDDVQSFVGDRLVLCHTNFDRASVSLACEKYNLQNSWKWVDTAKMVRRSMEGYRYSGYGLKSVCNDWGYEFNHHNALEDAKACGFIVIELMERTNSSFDDLVKLASYHSNPNAPSSHISREGNPDGDFYGQQICFTGSLSVPRAEAANIASDVGLAVKNSVSKKTNYLVVGDQDLTKLMGKDKSSKHKKAEELIQNGAQIRILKESDFFKLVSIKK